MKGIQSLRNIKPGDLYTKDGRDAWEVFCLCEHPTIELHNLKTGEKVFGAVGSLIIGDFVRLVPAEELSGQGNA